MHKFQQLCKMAAADFVEKKANQAKIFVQKCALHFEKTGV